MSLRRSSRGGPAVDYSNGGLNASQRYVRRCIVRGARSLRAPSFRLGARPPLARLRALPPHPSGDPPFPRAGISPPTLLARRAVVRCVFPRSLAPSPPLHCAAAAVAPPPQFSRTRFQ